MLASGPSPSRQRRAFALALLALACGGALSAASACGSTKAGDTGPSPSGPDAASEASSVTAARQSGRVIQALSDNLTVGGATITIAGKSVMAKDDGTYDLEVPRGVPYTMTVTADGYDKLDEQEWIFDKDTLARGDTSLLTSSLAGIFASTLPNRDPAKGSLSVIVVATPPCTTVEGATLTIDPPGSAKLAYTENKLPSTSRATVKAGEPVSAVFYNVEPGVEVTLHVASPSCAERPFPVAIDDVTYTGRATTEPGHVVTFYRVYLGDLVTDAGGD